MNIENLEEIYRQLHLIRAVEQHIVDVYETDVIKSPVHLSIGQEWVAVAACKNLLDGDAVINSYRGHATFLAKGGSLAGMIGELYGKTNGVARGKAGSMHLVDAEKRSSPLFGCGRHDYPSRCRVGFRSKIFKIFRREEI